MCRQCPESGCGCVQACLGVSDALETEPWELCRELAPLPEAEPELIFREREREQKALLIRAKEAELLFCVSHQAKAILSGMGVRHGPRGQTPVRLPSQRPNILIQLPMPVVPFRGLSWPRGRKNLRWCWGDRIWCRRGVLAATYVSWMAWGHGHVTYILARHGRSGRQRKWRSHQQ